MQFLYAETNSIKTNEVEVLFKMNSANIAHDVIKKYPGVRDELVKTFLWNVEFKPKIILTNDRDAFRKIVGSDIVIAFAVPDKDLIVLDTSRIYTKPFTLETTLKHELCHLLLHHNIEQKRLPRWLDEGICQWASGGIAELMTSDEGRTLAKASLSDSLIDIQELERFPLDERSLMLAYEESRSFIEYIVSEFGSRKTLQILEYLKQEDSINESVSKSLSINLFELEKKWQAYLKRKHTWFFYLSNNLYTIIFFLAGILTIYGFLRLLKKKRAYVDDDNENEE